jgi:putative transcriptional regulator
MSFIAILTESTKDWHMTKDAFDAVMDGLQDALAVSRGEKTGAVMHEVSLDVREIRAKLGLSQPNFAIAIGVPLSTLRNWEQRRRRPNGAALALLRIIDKEPEAARRALLAA